MSKTGYGLQWTEFDKMARTGLRIKQRTFASAEAREKFATSIAEKPSFFGIVARRDPGTECPDWVGGEA